MSFDVTSLSDEIAKYGAVIRVVVAQVRGSAPRGIGASMTIWAKGQTGTIGGGALEFDAADTARDMLRRGVNKQMRKIALGPEMGQCCGGAVVLLWERFDAQTLPIQFPYARAVMSDQPMPEPNAALPAYINGWLIEDHLRHTRSLWIYGAGHVGRAIVNVLAPLSTFEITWVDTGPERFPSTLPEGVHAAVAKQPELLAAHAPQNAEHLVLTYSHDMDLAICHAILTRGCSALGLIGSATKWARFRSRLGALGHSPENTSRIQCPIGDPSLGKAPAEIAIGVAAQILAKGSCAATREKIG
jgi:xanthine dehydrogenase accessory factor